MFPLNALHSLNLRIDNQTTSLRTSDSLNEGLSIKMTRESLKKNDIFSMNKIVGSTLDLSTKAVFSLNKYQLKIMG